MPKPINKTQVEFSKLCEMGGGQNGGPVVHKVMELLRSSGKKLNRSAYKTAAEHLEENTGASPWHVCFSIGLCWGHLAKAEIDFTQHVVRAIADLDDDEMVAASKYHYERGPDPILNSIRGARALFGMVTLPEKLPNSLDVLSQVQERWFGPILGPKRPPYIGSWNATAMFMAALFAQPGLAATQISPKPVLPPGGPVYAGLKMLFQTGVSSKMPDGTALDDAGFEPGVLYLNNNIFAEIRDKFEDWSILDVHSGLYMLGTRAPQSANWV
ncbi:MAG: hypothetical protein NVV67_19490 [Pseudoxanthomonas sp.]|nr:hypothetical protein [Pseudoxanthomonas sp.]